jgi:hypothetical protein
MAQPKRQSRVRPRSKTNNAPVHGGRVGGESQKRRQDAGATKSGKMAAVRRCADPWGIERIASAVRLRMLMRLGLEAREIARGTLDLGRRISRLCDQPPDVAATAGSRGRHAE